MVSLFVFNGKPSHSKLRRTIDDFLMLRCSWMKLNMIEIGGDAEEGGHQVQGEGNPKNTKKHQQNNI